MRLSVLLLAVLLLPVPAFAANWEYIGKDSDGYLYYVDKESVQTLSDGHRRFWEKMESDRYGKALKVWEFSCTGQYRLLQSRFYSSSKNSDTAYDGPDPWAYIQPDTFAQSEEKIVCK